VFWSREIPLQKGQKIFTLTRGTYKRLYHEDFHVPLAGAGVVTRRTDAGRTRQLDTTRSVVTSRMSTY